MTKLDLVWLSILMVATHRLVVARAELPEGNWSCADRVIVALRPES